MKSPFDRYTIEPHQEREGAVSVYGHGTYQDGVLKGTPRRAFLEHYDSVEQARAAYPRADEPGCSTRPITFGNESLADLSGLPKCPPSDFSEADAGERWDDDY